MRLIQKKTKNEINKTKEQSNYINYLNSVIFKLRQIIVCLEKEILLNIEKLPEDSMERRSAKIRVLNEVHSIQNAIESLQKIKDIAVNNGIMDSVFDSEDNYFKGL